MKSNVHRNYAGYGLRQCKIQVIWGNK